MIHGFYTIEQQTLTEKGFQTEVNLNAEHIIFKAHFPNNPITPGVCLLQITKELLEQHLHQKLFAKRIKNLKFLQPISPKTGTLVLFKIDYAYDNEQQVSAAISIVKGETLVAKISSLYICKS